jgi:hypothetical protein
MGTVLLETPAFRPILWALFRGISIPPAPPAPPSLSAVYRSMLACMVIVVKGLGLSLWQHSKGNSSSKERGRGHVSDGGAGYAIGDGWSLCESVGCDGGGGSDHEIVGTHSCNVDRVSRAGSPQSPAALSDVLMRVMDCLQDEPSQKVG